MRRKPVQLDLDLFPLSGIVVDEALDEDIVERALTHLQAKPSIIVYSIVHPDTIAVRMADLGKRDTWDLGDFTEINVNKKRMKTFRNSGHCECCGIEGNVYVIEQNVNDPTHAKYLNLYSVTEAGADEMTVDHKLCVSLGGSDVQANRNTMCRQCNQEKADTMTRDEIVYVLANLKRHVKSWVDPEYVRTLLSLHLLAFERNVSTRRQIKAACSRQMDVLRHQPKHLHSWDKPKAELKKLLLSLTTKPTPKAPDPVVVPSSWFGAVVNKVATSMRRVFGVDKALPSRV